MPLDQRTLVGSALLRRVLLVAEQPLTDLVGPEIAWRSAYR
ncbi:hypothetical protein [Micromonospora chokoriensis]|nr:hypothetical protein [Micromonospora chokoriensis]